MNDFAVDIPSSHDPEGEWTNLGFYETRDEAIAYARETFGADENGMIGLVSEVPDDDDDLPDDDDLDLGES